MPGRYYSTEATERLNINERFIFSNLKDEHLHQKGHRTIEYTNNHHMNSRHNYDIVKERHIYFSSKDIYTRITVHC